MSLTIFTENHDDTGLVKWINEWKERWNAADSKSYQHYRDCRVFVSQRLVSTENHYSQFRRLIVEGLEVDITFLIRFIKAGEQGNEFSAVEPYDVTKRSLQFPVLEKAFCALKDPGNSLQRKRVISNRQFRLSALHSEVMARFRHPSAPPGAEHVVLGIGDYSVWTEVVDDLHKKCAWVVCIDPCIP